MAQIYEIDDTDTQLDQAFLFGGFHKWVLSSLFEDGKRVRQVGEVAGGR